MKHAVVKRRAAQPDLADLSRVLPQIQTLLEASRQHVVPTANLALVWLYWNVGPVITEDIQQNQKREESSPAKILSTASRESLADSIRQPRSAESGDRLRIDFAKHHRLGWLGVRASACGPGDRRGTTPKRGLPTPYTNSAVHVGGEQDKTTIL